MIYPEYFIHPNDAKAMEALKAIPAFTLLSKKYSDLITERSRKIVNMSSFIRISERQLPEIYEMLPPICEKLEMSVPELYLMQDPIINANAFGEVSTSIVLTSGLLEKCPTEIIKAVIAHECGHIVCHHTTYHSLVHLFLTVGSSVLNIPLLTTALLIALLYWRRCSEYSADRVAGFVYGAEPVVRTQMIFASGSQTLFEKLDRDEFLKQAEDFHIYSEKTGWNKFMMYDTLLGQDHPFLVDRAAEILKWCDSKDYDDLCNGVPYTPPKPAAVIRCPKCGAPIDNETSFCSCCGTKIVHCPNCSAVFTEEDTFCDKCGSKLS